MLITCPLLLDVSTAAPCAMSSLATMSWPLRHAMCRLVLPWQLTASTSTPKSSSSRTTLIWPLADAEWSGVNIWTHSTWSRRTEYSTLETDWLIQLWFYVPLNTKWVISETFPQANLLAWYEKTKPNTTKACIHKSKEMYYNTKYYSQI